VKKKEEKNGQFTSSIGGGEKYESACLSGKQTYQGVKKTEVGATENS
jgi:hypothetical protein